MNYKLWIVSWLIFAISIVYWDIHRWEKKPPISMCHNTEIKIMNNKPMCTECKKYCEVIK